MELYDLKVKSISKYFEYKFFIFVKVPLWNFKGFVLK